MSKCLLNGQDGIWLTRFFGGKQETVKGMCYQITECKNGVRGFDSIVLTESQMELIVKTITESKK